MCRLHTHKTISLNGVDLCHFKSDLWYSMPCYMILSLDNADFTKRLLRMSELKLYWTQKQTYCQSVSTRAYLFKHLLKAAGNKAKS